MEKLFESFELRDGIWYSKSENVVSYPNDGNDNCYQVEDKSFWFIHRNKCILALIDQYLTSEDLFLDVGGGNGFVAKSVQDGGFKCAMVEPYLTGCINAKKRGVNYVIKGESNSLDISEGSFDAIGIFDVLEHIEQRQIFLKNLHKLLKPGGKLFITVPAYQKLWSYEDEVAGHFLRYTRKTLNAELQNAGFKSLFSSYLFSWLVLPIGLMRVLPYKLGKKHQAEVKDDHSEALLFQKVLNFEINRIKDKKAVRFGSSVIAVFRKSNI